MTAHAYHCFACFRVTVHDHHTENPFYEQQSLPSGIYLRACEAVKLMREQDRDHLADLWLDWMLEQRGTEKPMEREPYLRDSKHVPGSTIPKMCPAGALRKP